MYGSEWLLQYQHCCRRPQSAQHSPDSNTSTRNDGANPTGQWRHSPNLHSLVEHLISCVVYSFRRACVAVLGSLVHLVVAGRNDCFSDASCRQSSQTHTVVAMSWIVCVRIAGQGRIGSRRTRLERRESWVSHTQSLRKDSVGCGRVRLQQANSNCMLLNPGTPKTLRTFLPYQPPNQCTGIVQAHAVVLASLWVVNCSGQHQHRKGPFRSI